VGRPVVRAMDASRLEEVLAQIAHEFLIDHRFDAEEHRYRLSSEQQHKLPNLLLLVDKQGTAYERDFMDKTFTQGVWCMDKTYMWLFLNLQQAYGFDGTRSQVETARFKDQLSGMVCGITTRHVRRFLTTAFVRLISAPTYPVRANCPETLVLDIGHMANINKTFHLQHLVIRLVRVLYHLMSSSTHKAFDKFSMIEQIIKDVVCVGVKEDDVDQITSIISNGIKSKYKATLVQH
jgi:hypothetical protein